MLRRDKDTLAVLDVALQAGATSEVASSVRHVARLLSEKQDMNCQVRSDVTRILDFYEYGESFYVLKKLNAHF